MSKNDDEPTSYEYMIGMALGNAADEVVAGVRLRDVDGIGAVHDLFKGLPYLVQLTYIRRMCTSEIKRLTQTK
jgi:hypothetical protein